MYRTQTESKAKTMLVRRLLFGLALGLGVAQAATLSGRVLNADTRDPVEGAHVRVVGTVLGTVTDERGRFELPAHTDRATVEFSHVGYEAEVMEDLAAAGPILVLLRPAVIAIDGITVAAFRYPVSQDKAGPVTVLDPGRSTRTVGDLSELCRNAVSVLSRDYANFSALSLRGANNEHTLVTLDQIPLNSAQSGTFDLTTMPSSVAGRVEISRSGSSALYGSSPLGGAINVITPEPERFGARLTGNMGSLGRRGLRLEHTNRFGPAGYVLAGNLLTADNNYDYPDTAGTRRSLSNADVSSQDLLAKGLWRAAGHRAGVLVDMNRTERGVPGSRTRPSDSARRDDQRLLLQINYAFEPNAGLRTQVRGFHHRFGQLYRDPPFVPVSDTHRQTSTGVQLDQKLAPCDWALVLAGFDAEEARLASTSIGDPARLSLAGWCQARLERSGFGLNPIARFEHLGQTRSLDSSTSRPGRTVFSPKLTATWSGMKLFTVYAGLARSFRTPSFNDLYWPPDMFAYGNPDLRPERSASLDLGISSRQPGFLRYWLGGYYSGLTDLIQWQPDSASRYRPVNVDSAQIAGLELDVELNLERFGLAGNLNYCRAQSGNQPLIYRPRTSAWARAWTRLELDPASARLSLTAEHTGSRNPDTFGSPALPAYSLFSADAALGWRFRSFRATARFGLRNMLDRRYEPVKDYPAPGRTWHAELELEY